MIIVLFTTRAPHPLADALTEQGVTVYEALAMSEVLALVQQHPSAQIIITAGVDSERAKVIQQRYPTVKTGPEIP